MTTLKAWCIDNDKHDILEQWNYEKNYPLTPEVISFGSKKVVNWLCENNHSWEAPIYSRTSGTGCPYCSGRLPIRGETDLVATNPILALEWHPTRNGNLTPHDVKAGTSKKVWWKCVDCGHEWEAIISSRGRKGNGCPECGKKKISESRKTPRSGESLRERFPEIAAEWNYENNGELTPDNVKARSSVVVSWKCVNGHTWKSTISNRAGGRGCPICGNKKVETGFNDLATINPKLAKEWHPSKNGIITASTVLPSSSKRVWWLCSLCGHEWSATINNRTKRGCPRCSNGLQVSFPEKAIVYYLQMAGVELVENYRPDWMKRKELDIYIPSLGVGIEYDGEAWHKKGAEDLNKDILCLANGVGLIHIREPNCPRISGIGPSFVMADRKEQSLKQAIEFIFQTLIEDYGANLIIPEQIDVGKKRTEIYDLMELGMASNPLSVTHPELAREWHPTNNGELSPEMVTKGSDKKVWWICKNGHSWEASIAHRVAGKGCRFCNSRRIYSGYNDIATLYPELVEEWDFDKNDIIPEKCGKSSDRLIWWKCKKCGLSWRRTVVARVHGSGCPNCGNKQCNAGLANKEK